MQPVNASGTRPVTEIRIAGFGGQGVILAAAVVLEQEHALAHVPVERPVPHEMDDLGIGRKGARKANRPARRGYVRRQDCENADAVEPAGFPRHHQD